MVNKKSKSNTKKQEIIQIAPGVLKEALTKRSKIRKVQFYQFAKLAPLSSAFDEVLTQLNSLSETKDLDINIIYLLQEAQRWIIEGVDRILSSPELAEEARKLLELEFLLLDFAYNPSSLDEWANAEDWNRQSKFGFGELRRREEKRQGLNETMVVAARDYWVTHSVNSHPKPLNVNISRKISKERTFLVSLVDLLEHAKSVVIVAEIYINAQELVVPKKYPALSTKAIQEAWKRTHSTLHSHIPPDKFEELRQPRLKKRLM